MVIVEKRGWEIKKPKAVVDYNGTMGGVDKVYQNLSHYPLPRKPSSSLLFSCCGGKGAAAPRPARPPPCHPPLIVVAP
ncbi:hypothetical protein J437_LFUL004367 [Ladona fulva]|uniref:Uncharacterized protein n=1 Tax=Ladona fulva TaxID=123851 RepID=A0A8K0K4L0_LADFU|nr:hypothetical protein J437_LFUL004367 [Ladona fulva]